METTPEKFITVDEAAQILSLSPAAMRMRIHRKQITAYKIAGTRSVRLRYADILAMLEPVEVQA